MFRNDKREIRLEILLGIKLNRLYELLEFVII